ncbi:MAG: permease-like cell division protein FtsX [Planctomycetes bacterium]|jgi:cell division transport system permease protein|nr:permease-like cell division protein FtsX [Planctomycetota bacterium]
MLLSLIRIIKFSLQDVVRNVWLSVITVTILCLALFSINTLIVAKIISQGAVDVVKDKVDISLYLKTDATEDQIMALRSDLTNMDQIKNVMYVSKKKALDFFRLKNKNNPEILQSLHELGTNPLSPSLVITPKKTEYIPDLIQKLKSLENDIIESRDFTDNTTILNKINLITRRINQIGMLIIAVFIAISLLVVYNSVRMAVYTHRKEIAIMRLVGASNYFTFMPFVFSSLIYTLASILIIISLFYPFLSLIQPYLETFFMGYNINILSYYLDNFVKMFGLQFAIVAFINIIASLLAVKKYSEV